MRANFKAVIHFLRMQVLEVLCNCIVLRIRMCGTTHGFIGKLRNRHRRSR